MLSVSLAIVIAPSNFGTYNLLYLFPSFIFFLGEEEHKPFDAIVLIAIMIICFDYQWYPEALHWLNYHFGLLILTLYALTMAVFSVKGYSRGFKT